MSNNGSPAVPAPSVPDAARLREIAVRADADPRSVANYFKDAPLRASVARRIEKAMAELEREAAVTQAQTQAHLAHQDRVRRALAAGCNETNAALFAAQKIEFPAGCRLG